MDPWDRFEAANPVPQPLPTPSFAVVEQRLAVRSSRTARARLWAGHHLVLTSLGVLALGGTATAGVVALNEPRQKEATVVDFDVDNSAATANLVSIPLPPEVGDASGTAISPDENMLRVPERQLRLDPELGSAASGVEVARAVERRPEQAATATTGSGSVRVNYQAELVYKGDTYLVEVFQPSREDAARGIEGPGDRVQVDGVTAYVAHSGPGESWATTFADDGLFVSVSSKTPSEARLAVARALGWVR